MELKIPAHDFPIGNPKRCIDRRGCGSTQCITKSGRANNACLAVRFYKRLESNIRELVEKGDCRNIIVFSDHGNEKCPDYYFNVNTWLMKEGFLNLGKRTLHAGSASVVYQLQEQLSIVKKVGYKVAKVRLRYKGVGVKPPGIDWESTIAYANDFGIIIHSEQMRAEEGYESMRKIILKKMGEIRGINGEQGIAKVCGR